MTIEQVRNWINVCDAAGIGVPEQVRVLDAYATLLESRLLAIIENPPPPKTGVFSTTNGK